MNVEGPKAYVTYIYPLMFVVHEGEEIDFCSFYNSCR